MEPICRQVLACVSIAHTAPYGVLVQPEGAAERDQAWVRDAVVDDRLLVHVSRTSRTRLVAG